MAAAGVSTIMSRPVHVITMCASAMPTYDGELTALPLIKDLKCILEKNGGILAVPILLGDATLQASVAMDDDLGPFDILITKHTSIEAYQSAIETEEYQSISKFNKIITFGFTNKTLQVDLFYPLLKARHKVLKKVVDCDTKADQDVLPGYQLYQVTGHRGLDSYKEKVNIHPDKQGYLLNLHTKNESPEGREADERYMKAYMEAAYAYDLNLLFTGPIISLDGGPKSFKEISLFLFPTREILISWLESEYHINLEDDRTISLLDRFVQICLAVY